MSNDNHQVSGIDCPDGLHGTGVGFDVFCRPEGPDRLRSTLEWGGVRARPLGLPLALRPIGGLRSLQAGWYAASGSFRADQRAYATLLGLVQRETTMVALIQVFQYLGVLDRALIPLISFTKRPPKGESS